ncbi:MAG TPA: hypothetical protein DCL99_04315 [Firmicutes bacterium]|nr:hypothetical protein [Bacillota bacterium]
MRKLLTLLLATALLAGVAATGLAQGSTRSISQTKYILVGLEVSPFVKITFPTVDQTMHFGIANRPGVYSTSGYLKDVEDLFNATFIKDPEDEDFRGLEFRLESNVDVRVDFAFETTLSPTFPFSWPQIPTLFEVRQGGEEAVCFYGYMFDIEDRPDSFIHSSDDGEQAFFIDGAIRVDSNSAPYRYTAGLVMTVSSVN